MSNKFFMSVFAVVLGLNVIAFADNDEGQKMNEEGPKVALVSDEDPTKN